MQKAVDSNNLENSKAQEHFWIKDGDLIYDEDAHTKKILIKLDLKPTINTCFVNLERIEALKSISSVKFDFTRLIKFCEEINDAYKIGNYLTVGVLTRCILDHIPPIFEKRTFIELANNYGNKSFKEVMEQLEKSNRKISDSFLHSQIKSKDSLPNETSIDCKNSVDFLLAEILTKF